MPDNKQVLDPGWRATDANVDAYSGAKLKFFQADGVTPRTVYQDSDLSSSLGSVITCDSGGYPTSDGNAKTLIFTGLNDFVLDLYTSADVFVWRAEMAGALDTSGFGGDTRITSPTDSVSTDQVLAFSDSGKLYNVNCSGGAVTFTLGAATTLEDGWRVGIRHNGSANQVKIVTTGGELIALPNLISTTAFSITSRGQEVWIRCDGAGFTVGETAPALLNTVGVINITDRLSAPPVSPTPGARYILLTTPTGDWSTFSQHDIVEANGNGGWIRYTPAADCGWVAYVQDEDCHYHFLASAWVARTTASSTVEGYTKVSTQALMEAGTATDAAVLIGHQKFHKGHPKAWGLFGVSGNVVDSYGVTSISDDGTGTVSATLSTAFSSANFLIHANPWHVTNANAVMVAASSTTGFTLKNYTIGNSPSLVDPTLWSVSALGDQ